MGRKTAMRRPRGGPTDGPRTVYVPNLIDVARQSPRGEVLLPALVSRIRRAQGAGRWSISEIESAIRRKWRTVKRPYGETVLGLALTQGEKSEPVDDEL